MLRGLGDLQRSSQRGANLLCDGLEGGRIGAGDIGEDLAVHFDPGQVQISTLLSIKTGGCPEDCGYCTQSVHNHTGLKATKLMEVEAVLAEA